MKTWDWKVFFFLILLDDNGYLHRKLSLIVRFDTLEVLENLVELYIGMLTTKKNKMLN